jgi:hypothetical protein
MPRLYCLRWLELLVVHAKLSGFGGTVKGVNSMKLIVVKHATHALSTVKGG